MTRRAGSVLTLALAAALAAGQAGAGAPENCEDWPSFDDKEAATFKAEVWEFADAWFEGYRLSYGVADFDREAGEFRFPGASYGAQRVLLRKAPDGRAWQFLLHSETEARFRRCARFKAGRGDDREERCSGEETVDKVGYLVGTDFRDRAAKIQEMTCKRGDGTLVTVGPKRIAARGEGEGDDREGRVLGDGKGELRDLGLEPGVEPRRGDGEKPPLGDLDGVDIAKTGPAKEETPPRRGGTLGDLLGDGAATPDGEGKDKGKDGDKSLGALTKGEGDGKAAPGKKGGNLADLLAAGDDGTPDAGAGEARRAEGDAAGRGDADKGGEVRADGGATPGNGRARDDGAPRRNTGEVCEIVDIGRRAFAIFDRPARGLTDEVTALFAGLRTPQREATVYTVDRVASYIERTEDTITLGPTADQVIAYTAQGRVDGDGAGHLVVSFDDLGRDEGTPAGVDLSLPPINVMVFGGDSVTHYSGLAGVEEKLASARGEGYRLNIRFHKLNADAEFAEPATFASFADMIRATPPLDGTPPWVNLREDQVGRYFDGIAERIETTDLERIDHIIILQGPYSLPRTALDSADKLIKLVRTSDKVNRDFKYLSVIAARTSDHTYAFLADPITKFGDAEFYLEPEDVNKAREREGKPPQILSEIDQQVLATKLNTRFAAIARTGAPAEGAVTLPPGSVAVNAAEIFETMGIVASTEALIEMQNKTSQLLKVHADLTSRSPAPRGSDVTEIAGLSIRSSLIDLITPKDGSLSARYTTPDWLNQPIARLDAGQTQTAFANLERLDGLLRKVLAAVEAKCGLVYIPLDATFTEVDTGR